MFDNNIAIEVRLLLYNTSKSLAAERAEKEKALKEKEQVLNELLKSNTLIRDLQRDNSLLAPRAVIEFVETFVFDKYQEVKGTSRVEKWESFFLNIDIGKRIYSCTKRKIPLWSGKERTMAERVADMYRSTSDYHHQTSLEIEETKLLSLNQTAVVQQTVIFITCVAEHCGLKLTI
jgi:hypothetical protein